MNNNIHTKANLNNSNKQVIETISPHRNFARDNHPHISQATIELQSLLYSNSIKILQQYYIKQIQTPIKQRGGESFLL
jgi:hypothetical protein